MLDKRVFGVHDTKVKNMMQQASIELERLIIPFKDNVRLAAKVKNLKKNRTEQNKTKQNQTFIIKKQLILNLFVFNIICYHTKSLFYSFLIFSFKRLNLIVFDEQSLLF
jgi:hypothetical protein